jgi:tetratricopeptide (TPR) repeat protein
MFTTGLAMGHSAAGRYEQAAQWADRSLREQPRFTAAIRFRVIACAMLGHIAEAHDWLERLLELQPGLTIAKYKAYAAFFCAGTAGGLFDRSAQGRLAGGVRPNIPAIMVVDHQRRYSHFVEIADPHAGVRANPARAVH